MTYDWDRLARAIRQRRADLGWTQAALGDAAGIAAMTVRNLEGGRQFTRLPQSAIGVERALGWTAGSIRTVLEGGDPTLAEEDEPAGYLAELPSTDGTRVFVELVKDLADLTPKELAEVTAFVEYVKARIANGK